MCLLHLCIFKVPPDAGLPSAFKSPVLYFSPVICRLYNWTMQSSNSTIEMVAHPRLHKCKSAWPPLYSHQPASCVALPLGLFCDIWVAGNLSWWHWLLRGWRWVMIYLQWYLKRGEVHTDCTVLSLGQISVSLCLSVCLSLPPYSPFFSICLSFSLSISSTTFQ